MTRIAFIGLGNMGGGMAARLVGAGHEVSAFDLSAEALERAAGRGCTPAASVREAVASAEAVITMLPAGPQVRAVYEGEILGQAPAGALLIDASTIDVETARAVAQKAAEAGYVFADAPVSGGTAGAFARIEALLAPMARAVLRAGDHGAGQAAKICNNMLLGISMIGTCEAFALAERLGLEPDKFFDIASKSSGQCWSLTSYSPWPGLVETAPSNRDYAGGFAVAMMLKDLKLAQAAAASNGASTPLGAQAEALYALWDRLGNSGKDFSSMLQFLRGGT
jgi:3-hydroxyisobutyrate dehydrogenase